MRMSTRVGRVWIHAGRDKCVKTYDEACCYWAKGWCSRGDGCRYYHEDPTGAKDIGDGTSDKAGGGSVAPSKGATPVTGGSRPKKVPGANFYDDGGAGANCAHSCGASITVGTLQHQLTADTDTGSQLRSAMRAARRSRAWLRWRGHDEATVWSETPGPDDPQKKAGEP